jgi:cytochrome c-type biogenesis protein CcmH/NrfG
MNSNKVMVFSTGFVAGLIAGIILMSVFSGPSGGGTATSSAPAPVTPQQQGPDRLKVAQDIRQLEDILGKDPKNYQGWVQLGNDYFDVGESQKSIDAYTKALALNDKDPNVWTDMGVMYRALKNPKKAIEVFEKAIALDPRHAASRLNLGVVYLHDLNNYPAAVKAWEEFLKVEPSGPRAQQVSEQLDQLRKMAAGGGTGSQGTDLDAAARELGKQLNQPPAK